MSHVARVPWAVVGAVALLVCQACDCAGGVDEPGECVDLDGDGYGPGCRLGPDCDDTDPALNFSCDCELIPHVGCACTDEEPITCFEGDQALVGRGVCRAGERACSGGSWGECVGQVLPAAERCNGLDDDCDGETDEEAGCSGCGPRCTQEEIGQGGQTFLLDDQNGRGLKLNPDGSISLEEQSEQVRLTFLWVANSDEGTVSKIDTRTGREVGRYASALSRPGPRNRGHAQASGNAPSRTAVDWNGDVWVANRAFNQQGTVTKIAHQGCLDVNGDGQIQTSRDANGDGRIDLGDPLEFLGEDDECILFTVDAGGVNDLPRALALDSGDTMDGGRNNAWVGLYNGRRFLQLAGDDGRVLAQVDVPLTPYGAAIDSRGVLWATGVGTAQLSSIDVRTKAVAGPFTIQGCEGSYGIAIDAQDRVWVGAYGAEGACRYDPATGAGMAVVTSGVGVGRGIAADADGFIWVAHSWTRDNTNVGRVTRFRADDGGGQQTFDFSDQGWETIGVGLDFDGHAWAVNRSTDNACRIDKDTGAVTCYPTGHGTYTYSDFTGYALRTFTAPRGTYAHVFSGCLGVGTRWKQVAWDASVPAGTSLKVFVQAADSLDGLGSAPRHGPFESSPADLLTVGEVTGHYLRVEVQLASDTPGLSPILRSLSVQRVCAGEQ